MGRWRRSEVPDPALLAVLGALLAALFRGTSGAARAVLRSIAGTREPEGSMELLPGRIEGVATAYGYVRTVFDQVASGERGPTVSITPSIRHVGVTRRDTFRPGFSDAVRASREEGYPVLVRGAGGGATAAHYGTFGFSIIRPSDGAEAHRGITDRYDEAAALALGAFSRLGVRGVAVGRCGTSSVPGTTASGWGIGRAE